MSDMICAIATGLVRSGIGVIRMSGAGCIEAAGNVFSPISGNPLSATPDRKLVLGTLYDAQKRPIDQCLAFISRAPASYTGEDTAELQCHGSPAALTAALESLFAAGFRQAGPGEFTRRAFLNGRLDLTQAEAVIDLIDAPTAEAAANAAGQLSGAISARIDPIYDSLVDLLSHFHAIVDYPDELLDPLEIDEAEKTLSSAKHALLALLDTAKRGRFICSGVRAAIVGSTNAGKSSLINMLCNHKGLAKTSATPGKTLLINHFIINNEWYLVDLPGYGFAKRSKTVQKQLEQMISSYILQRQQLANVFVLIDVRHDQQKIDREFVDWLGESGVPFCIVFTKADKLGPVKARMNAEKWMHALEDRWEALPPYFITSSEKKMGRDEVLDYIDEINKSLAGE